MHCCLTFALTSTDGFSDKEAVVSGLTLPDGAVFNTTLMDGGAVSGLAIPNGAAASATLVMGGHIIQNIKYDSREI